MLTCNILLPGTNGNYTVTKTCDHLMYNEQMVMGLDATGEPMFIVKDFVTLDVKR